MSEAGEIRRMLGQKFQTKQNRIGAMPAQLGDGSGRLGVTGRTNYYYARLAGSVIEVYNNRVAPANDLLVMVGYDPLQPDLFQVLSTRTAAPGGAGSGGGSGYAPALRYQWLAPGGGQDPLLVEKRALLPLRIAPKTGMVIRVYRDLIWNGAGLVTIPTQEVDLSDERPTDDGLAALVLITVNTDGTIVKTKGAEFILTSITTDALMLAQIPAPPSGTVSVLGAVRVYTHQVAVQEARTSTDIIDLRFTGWTTAATIQLDDLGAPDDNTNLNATTAQHGLLPKLSGVATQFLNGLGAWAVPAGGAGGTDPVHPDTPPATPDAMDDEFTDEALDAKWTTLFSTGLTPTVSFANSRLVVRGPANNSYSKADFLQPAPTGTWRVQAKLTLEGPLQDYYGIGLVARNSSTDKRLTGSALAHGNFGPFTLWAGRYTNETLNSEVNCQNIGPQTLYFEMEATATHLLFKVSNSGTVGTFVTFHSETLTNHLGTLNQIGLHFQVMATGATPLVASCDWFRRVA